MIRVKTMERDVFEFFKRIIPYAVPIFVVFTMLNVGLTQKLSVIIGHLKNSPFVLKMLIANFIIAPAPDDYRRQADVV